MLGNRKDPLTDAVKKVMEHNQNERRIIAEFNSELGINDRRQLPHEKREAYDQALANRLNEDTSPKKYSPKQKKLAANAGDPNKIDAADLKKVRMQGHIEEEGSEPRTSKEKDLAAMKPPYDKITKADVLKARGVIKQEAFKGDPVPFEASEKKGKLEEADKKKKTVMVVLKEPKTEKGKQAKKGGGGVFRLPQHLYDPKKHDLVSEDHEDIEEETDFAKDFNDTYSNSNAAKVLSRKYTNSIGMQPNLQKMQNLTTAGDIASTIVPATRATKIVGAAGQLAVKGASKIPTVMNAIKDLAVRNPGKIGAGIGIGTSAASLSSMLQSSKTAPKKNYGFDPTETEFQAKAPYDYDNAKKAPPDTPEQQKQAAKAEFKAMQDRESKDFADKHPGNPYTDPRTTKDIPLSKPRPTSMDEEAVSKAQHRFMGLVYAIKKGKAHGSPEAEKAASGMSTKEARKFAKTKEKGLPEKVDESFLASIQEEIRTNLLEKAHWLNENGTQEQVVEFLNNLTMEQREILNLSEQWAETAGTMGKHIGTEVARDVDAVKQVGKNVWDATKRFGQGIVNGYTNRGVPKPAAPVVTPAPTPAAPAAPAAQAPAPTPAASSIPNLAIQSFGVNAGPSAGFKPANPAMQQQVAPAASAPKPQPTPAQKYGAGDPDAGFKRGLYAAPSASETSPEANALRAKQTNVDRHNAVYESKSGKSLEKFLREDFNGKKS